MRRDLLERRRALLAQRAEAIKAAHAERFKRRHDVLEARRLGEHWRAAQQAAQPSAQLQLPPDHFISLADARAALDFERHSRPSSGLAAGLAIGLAAVAVAGVGIVICYLLLRKDQQQQPSPVGLAAPQEIVINTTTKKSKKGKVKPLHESLVKTLALPVLGNPRLEARAIMNATEVPWRVQLRTLGPTGGAAVFSFEAVELNLMGIGTLPQGSTFILPAGGSLDIVLAPHQTLFGKGSVRDVNISVTGSEARDLMI